MVVKGVVNLTNKITYEDITYSSIDRIKELWERNRAYHEATSEFFSEAYKGLIFEDRITGFSNFDQENIKITVASVGTLAIGYCLSIKEGLKGEVATLHVVEEHRGEGIGKDLMNQHLEWLRSNKCDDIKVVVSQENMPTIEFYKSLGFYPNTVEMFLKEK